MAVNFALALPVDATRAGGAPPVLDGATIEEMDQAPTGSWVEVSFAELAGLAARGLSEAFIHISTDTALRFLVSATSPGSRVGNQVLAGVDRTIGIAPNLKLWIK